MNIHDWDDSDFSESRDYPEIDAESIYSFDFWNNHLNPIKYESNINGANLNEIPF